MFQTINSENFKKSKKSKMVVCKCCKDVKTKGFFSNAQLKKKSDNRICKSCTTTSNVPLVVPRSSSELLKTFHIWLSDNGTKYPGLDIKEHTDIYRSVVSKKRLVKNSIVLEVPRKCIMTRQDAIESKIGKEMTERKYQPQSTHTWLAFFVLEEIRSGTSFFKPYLDLLPSHYKNFPSFYNEEELEKLSGCYVLDMLKQRNVTLKEEFEHFIRSFPEYNTIYTLSDFVWARIVIVTRVFGFQTDDTATEGLVPMADMLNHKNPPGTQWRFDKARNAFTIISTKICLKGSELFDSYGPKSNSRYLVNYGFTLDNNYMYNQTALFVDRKDFSRTTWLQHLGQPKSFDDGFSGYNVLVLNKMETRVSKDGNFRFQIPTLQSITKAQLDGANLNQQKITPATCVKAYFGLLRWLLCTEQELVTLETRSKKQFELIFTEPISHETEMKVLNQISTSCQERLTTFHTSLEDDYKTLETLKQDPFSNKANICRMLISEKEVLHWYIDLNNFVMVSFQKNPRKVQKDLRTSPKFSQYGDLMWKCI